MSTEAIAVATEAAEPVVDPLAEIEERITKQFNPRPIRLVPMKKRRSESLQEFLVKFFTEWNNEKETIYVDDRATQTPPGKRRSLGDIFSICRYYYSDCTLKEVLNQLYVELIDVMPEGFRTSLCSQIKKRVWYFAPTRESDIIDGSSHDEFGKTVGFYKRSIK